MRANHQLQSRLKSEFERINYEDYRYEVKRGEDLSGNVLTNEEAGRLLLAFDLGEPWSCHQIYKVFDDKHADIFGRPLATAWRIILLTKLMSAVQRSLPHLADEPFANYTLTRFFILHALSRLMAKDQWAVEIIKNPRETLQNPDLFAKFLTAAEQLATRLVIDLKYEAERQEAFDYKVALKSPVQVERLASALQQSYDRDVARGREKLIRQLVEEAI
jgi:hypothetical protein